LSGTRWHWYKRSDRLYGIVLGLWFGLRARLGRPGFYLLFAVSVTASVQLVGVYLVFATLIIPALATRGIEHEQRRLFTGYSVGLMLSALLDLPTGAVIVLSLAVISGFHQ
jgi:zinc/manganese transport system permease protein